MDFDTLLTEFLISLGLVWVAICLVIYGIVVTMIFGPTLAVFFRRIFSKKQKLQIITKTETYKPGLAIELFADQGDKVHKIAVYNAQRQCIPIKKLNVTRNYVAVDLTDEYIGQTVLIPPDFF